MNTIEQYEAEINFIETLLLSLKCNIRRKGALEAEETELYLKLIPQYRALLKEYEKLNAKKQIHSEIEGFLEH